MKFEIPFDEQIFLSQSMLNFDVAWKKNNQANKRRLLWGIPLLLIGIGMLYFDHKLGYMWLAIGLHYLIKYIEYILVARKARDAYIDKLDEYATKEKKANQDTIWKFEEEHLFFHNHQMETKITWETFKGLRVIDKTLFLDLDMAAQQSFLLNDEEIGEEKFAQLITLLKTKIDH